MVLDVAAKGGPRKQQTRAFHTLLEARTHVTKHRAGRQSGNYVAPTVETLADLCNRWLASRRDIRPVTVEGYRNVLAPVLRRIGSKKVQALSSPTWKTSQTGSHMRVGNMVSLFAHGP